MKHKKTKVLEPSSTLTRVVMGRDDLALRKKMARSPEPAMSARR